LIDTEVATGSQLLNCNYYILLHFTELIQIGH